MPQKTLSKPETEISAPESQDANPRRLSGARYNEEAKQHFINGDLETAERLFRRAIRADARLAEPYSNLAVLYWQRGEIGAALYELTQALRIDPNHLDTVINYGQICLELGRADVAQRVFGDYLQRNPDVPEIQRLLAEASATSHSQVATE